MASVDLHGVWLHTAVDPTTTSRRYPYNRAVASRDVGVTQTARQYAGRTFPVVEYGDTETVTVAVELDGCTTADIDALASLVRDRTTIVYRDSLGRVTFGAIAGWSETPTDIADVTVTFVVQAVDDTAEV